MSYAEELGRELTAVGISGRRRARILLEIEDHLAEDPEAGLGQPRALAQRFADELGTRRSRRAAYAAFAGLGVAGTGYTVAFVAASGLGGTARHPHSLLLAGLATVVAVVAPQLAFAAGSLALLRAYRRRRAVAMPAVEIRVLVRRTYVGLGSGLAAMGAVALLAGEYGVETGIAYAAAAVGGGALLLAAPPALAAARVHSTAPGSAGDVLADLGPLVPEGLRDPWRIARLVALVVGLAVWAAGIVQGDPIDGLLRGAAEALACLGGFALLGGFLGLRRR